MSDIQISYVARTKLNVFIENNDRVSSLMYSWKHDRLLCSGGFRLNIGPVFDKYMEWGFIDGGIRFYNAENKKVNHMQDEKETVTELSLAHWPV